MPLFDNQVLDRNFADSARPAEMGQALGRRVEMLREPERTLFRLLTAGNVSRRQLAHMLQIPPGTLTRRVRRLANRLHDPIVVMLCEPRCPLPADYRQLGIEHFLQGQSIGQLADLHRMPERRVRDILSFIRGWQKGMALARHSA